MKILVLCHGNINRSPFVAGLLRWSMHEIRGAGFVNPGKRAAKKMRDAAPPLGVDLSEHRSRLVDQESIDWADLIIYMDGGNRARLQALAPDSLHKARCLASFCPGGNVTRIPDPAFMATGSSEFEDVVYLMTKCVANLLTVIAEGKALTHTA